MIGITVSLVTVKVSVVKSVVLLVEAAEVRGGSLVLYLSPVLATEISPSTVIT